MLIKIESSFVEKHLHLNGIHNQLKLWSDLEMVKEDPKNMQESSVKYQFFGAIAGKYGKLKIV